MMQRILTLRFSALGDVAMTVPVIYSLARKYPQLRIDVVTSRFCAGLFIDAPANIIVHGLDLKKHCSGISGIFHLVSYLYRLKPDAIADLHNVSRTWLISTTFRLKGIKVEMLDKMRLSRSRVLSKKIQHPPMIKRYEEVFSRLGLPVDSSHFIRIFETKAVTVPEKIETPAIGISPFARYKTKTYPLEKMEHVIRSLCKDGYHIYLFGARGKEAAVLESLAARYESCISLAGKYSLAEEIGMMSEMQTMVAMDSANHHLASLAGIPVVSVWGSTSPECGFMAFSHKRDNAISLSLDCKPCSIAGLKECPNGTLKCLASISPESIVDKVRQSASQQE